MKKWLNRKRKTLCQYIVTYRFWLLNKLFTEDEKGLMIRAIENRVNSLERIMVSERWADKDNILIDCADYSKLKTIFFTNNIIERRISKCKKNGKR